MRIVRYKPGGGKNILWGWVSEGKVGSLEGDPFGAFRRKKGYISLERVELFPPVQPGKIVCVGRNYVAHAEEHDAEVPEIPLIFLKPPSSVIGDGGTILLPPQSERVEHEAELAVVIGLGGRWIKRANALEHVLGYTIANDITARDLQRGDGQWTRGKGFDTFCPVGPWIETDLDPSDLIIKCSVNDQLRQMGTTRDMVFPVPTLVAFVSSVMTLNPGDLILTGTPSGVGPLVDGNDVEVEIEGIGTLHNRVKSDQRSAE
ncbi:MAG: fumarylacetoacetate hydrolase family protein [Anaerolineales bacterium]|nr:fumarylacetoacetate hydrolase family protein [Anaerolineales bacterium]